MIFVTTGTQLVFPRLVDAMAALAPGLEEDVIAQAGPDQTARATLTQHEHLSSAEFTRLFTSARVVVAHAGIGTILSAKSHRKPLILMPRRFALGEHRNDHQMATARQVEHMPGIHIAWEVEDLEPLLRRPDLESAAPGLGPRADSLIARLRDEIARP